MTEIRQGDIKKQQQEESLKNGGNPWLPLAGTSYSAKDMSNNIILRNPGNPNDYRMQMTFGDPRYKNTADTQSARVGDYVFTKNGPVAATNSVTDYVQRYTNIVGGTNRKGLSFSDWMDALKVSIGGMIGAPTDSSNVGSFIGTTVASQAVRKTPLAPVWGFGTLIDQLNKAQERYNEEWANTMVDYSSAVSFKDDGNGGKIAVLDYDKIGTAIGPGNGSGITAATNTDDTRVELTDTNNLKIVASSAFVNSSAYQDVVKKLTDSLTGLDKESADEIVDSDTGTTRLQAIEELVKSAESNFYYNARSIATLKEVAPTASEEALARGSYTMLAGYVKTDSLKEMTISVYNKDNQLEELNAEEYFDSIQKMGKTERNDYMLSLGDRINDDEISDDEKAVLQAQANALYALSDGSDKYKGMYNKDLWDTIGDTGGLITGIRLGDWGKAMGGYGSLSTFKNDDIASGLLNLGSGLGGMFVMSKIVNGLEGLFRQGTTSLGNFIGDNKVGNFLKNLDGFAPQDVGQSIGSAASELGKSGFKTGAKALGTWAAKTATQVGYQTLADAAYDTAKAVAYNITGNDYDFMNELKTDFLLDTLMTYGPSAYRNAMSGDGSKYEYRSMVLDEAEAKKINAGLEGDEFVTKMAQAGDTEYKLIKVTAQELSQRRAAVIDKLTDSKIGLKVQKLFFDKNAAMNKLAVQVLKVTGNNYLFRKTLRAAGDIKALTRWSENDFRRVYGENLGKLGEVLKEVAPKFKDFTQADADYINAMGNKERLIKKAEGNEKQIAKIRAAYDPAIRAVDPERAAQLDKLRKAMSAVASDVLANYKRMGILDSKAVKRIAAYEGYYPVWTKNKVLNGGDILQTRAKAKNINDPNQLIALEDLENPLVSLTAEINNMARNVAINERALAIREAARVAGVDIHIYSDTGGGLKEVTNLRQLNERFEKRYQNIRKKTLEEFPNKKQWQDENDKLVLSSKAFAKYDELTKLQNEAKDLKNRLRREQRKLSKAGSAKEARELSKQVFETKAEIEMNRQAQGLALDDVKKEAVKTLKKAAKLSKAPMSIDIKKYTDVELTNMLKGAIKKNNAKGAIQAVLNKVVETANPWVDPELVIQTRAEAAAQDFRKKVNKEMAFKKSAMPTDADKINAIADRVTDYVVEKALGKKRATVTNIGDEDVPSRTYTVGKKKNQIKYRLDGNEYIMTLTGKGAEALVEEFDRPEATVPKTVMGKIGQKLLRTGNKMAQAKRYLTTASDPSRMLPNLFRDWSRGIVTTGGLILLSPSDLRTDVIESGKLNQKAIERMDQGWRLVADAMKGSTFTKSMETPKKNRAKTMREAFTEPDGDGFVEYTFGRTFVENAKDAYRGTEGVKDFLFKNMGEKFSLLQDTAETFTRMRAMSTAYYNEVGKAVSRGASMDQAIEEGMEAAYMYGVEATVNFSRRGALIEKFAQQVPYLTQKFATLESFKNAWLDDPIAVSNSLKTTVTAYAGAIAILLSNEESRRRYYMLSEYERANNIIISLDNEHIIKIPLDDTIAAFLTPYRRAIETLNGVDPEAFYLWGVEFLEALSPMDLSGFSEGDTFNIQRGFEKLGSEFIPTWAQPFIEAQTGRDLYYGSDISMTEEEVGEYYGLYTPTPGQMTTKGKNSKHLAAVADATKIPQWILQNFLAEYGGNVSQYILAGLDKLAGATDEEQGGKDFVDAIFKPFTGNDSSNVTAAFNSGISALQEEKKKVQNELKTINKQLETAVGEDRANILNHRQEVINNYGVKVTDFVNQYLSAYEITGGLTATQANRIWFLYTLYDENENTKMLSNLDDAGEDYYYSKAKTLSNRRSNALAAMSGLDKYVDGRVRDPNNDYYQTYGAQLFQNSVYGSKMSYVNGLYKILEKNSLDLDKSFYDLRQEMYDARDAAYKRNDFTGADAIAYEYDKKVVAAVLKYIEKSGKDVEDVIDNSQVIDYLSDWIAVPSSFMKTKKGKYVPSLMAGAQKEKAFKKPFIKYIFGIEED